MRLRIFTIKTMGQILQKKVNQEGTRTPTWGKGLNGYSLPLVGL